MPTVHILPPTDIYLDILDLQLTITAAECSATDCYWYSRLSTKMLLSQ